MSAESVQAYVNWIKQSGGINSQAASQLNSITAQLNALNPSNPNSTAQLAALQRQAQAIVNSRDSQIAALGPTPNPANLTERERAQVGAQVGLNAGNGLIDYRGALNSLQSAGAAAQRNIGTTQSAGTSRGQTAPVTTGNGTSTPVTNVAASANTTTRTSVTNTSNTTGTPAPAPRPAAQPATANTADIPISVTTSTDLPTRIVTEPITVDTPQFDRRGRQTGTEQVTLNLAPVTVDDEPLAVSVAADADIPLVVPEIDQELLDEVSIRSQIETERAISPFQTREDWRVRLALSDDPSVNYLYKASNPGILKPLQATSGVIFPYTPTIGVNYTANYNPTDLVHSNYKVYQYSNSAVESINIQGEFTAQDEYDANYLLAAIHFFRSATKMFYGQDQNPRRGTPPPLCYIYGMGSYQFAGQPLAITGFSYNLPNNVDYIKTTVGNLAEFAAATRQSRLPPEVNKGGVVPQANFVPISEPDTVSWVPSRIQLSVTCVPMMSRNQVSNEFSFEKYATGALLNGVGKTIGGFW